MSGSGQAFIKTLLQLSQFISYKFIGNNVRKRLGIAFMLTVQYQKVVHSKLIVTTLLENVTLQ